jgi:ActR/RegA family two-component response regulator
LGCQTKGRVLLVDDEIDIARTLGRILETSGFKVDIFTDPNAASGSFKTAYYDLAAIDVRMPDSNYTPKLFLTALRDLHDYDDFKSDVSPKLHQRHFIQKPVTHDEFLDEEYCILY